MSRKETLRPNEQAGPERWPTPLLEKGLEKLGLTEVLPGEREQLDQIRWTAYQVKTTLRLEKRGRYIFDPQEELTPSSITNQLAVLIQTGAKPNLDKFGRLLPQADSVLLQGSLKRVFNHPTSRRMLKNGSPENLALAATVLEREMRPKKEVDQPKHPALIVAHKGVFQPDHLLGKVLDDSWTEGDGKKKKLFQRASELATAIAFTFGTPYMGAAVIMSELERWGVDKMPIIDFRDCLNGKVDQVLETLKPETVFLTGVLSFDIGKLAEIVHPFQEKGIRVVAGGLGPTIDPFAISRSTDIDVFIGEGEDAVGPMMDILENASPEDRFIFHRGLPPRQETEKPYLLVKNPNLPNTWDAYLNLPRLVNREKYYSPEKERQGALAQRLRHEMKMVPTIQLFGKEWDAPPLGEQISTTVGCPEACLFCSTPNAHGPHMRRLPLESAQMRADVAEARYLVATDQNFGAIDPSETEEEYFAWVVGFLRRLKANNQRLLCQTDVAFFERVARHPEIATLVSETIGSALVGLEQPSHGTKGSALKNPTQLPQRLEVAKNMRIAIWGSGVYGLPSSFCSDLDHPNSADSPISIEEWKGWLKELDIPILILFPFMSIPGAKGVKSTGIDDPNPLSRYHQHKYQPRDLEVTGEIMRDFYQPGRILRRLLVEMRGYSPKRRAFTLALSLGIASLYASGLGARGLRESLKDE